MKPPRAPSPEGEQHPPKTARAVGRLWGAMAARFRPPPKVADAADAAEFIAQHSAHAAQSALYGYIKTRAGFEYFRLFDDDEFVRSINIAKWNIRAACAGDLAVFCGAHLCKHLPAPPDKVAAFMDAVIVRVFDETPAPPDAGPDYPRLVQEAKARVRGAHWESLPDDETTFARSPDALVYWAPVADELKTRDAEIVRNSIAFKWKETRDKFRRQADRKALRKAMGLTN